MSQRPRTVRIEQDDGVRLHAMMWDPDDDAAGSDVLLVHGLASNALLWTGVAERLRAAGHRVVAVDLRAHGRSDPSDELGWDRVTRDLMELAAALGLARPLAVGQSWGGNVVLELAHRHPDAVCGVVGIDGGAIELSASFPDWDACWAALAPPGWDGVGWPEVERSTRDRTVDWPDGSAEALLGNLVRRADGTAAAILTRDRHRRILRHLWNQRPSDRWSSLEVPMVLVPAFDGGSSDPAKRAAADAAERSSAHLRVEPIEPADHDVHLQQPGAVAEVVHRTILEVGS